MAAALAAERITDDELDEMERHLAGKAEAIANNDMEKLVDVDTRFHELIYQASAMRDYPQSLAICGNRFNAVEPLLVGARPNAAVHAGTPRDCGGYPSPRYPISQANGPGPYRKC